MIWTWPDVEHAAIALSASGAIAAIVLTPFADKIFVWMFTRSRNEVMVCINTWYRDSQKEHDESISKLAMLDLRFHDFVTQQAQRDGQLLGEFREMFARQNELLSAIQEEAQATAKSVSHIYGILDQRPWDGTERRRIERRGPREE